MRAFLSAAAAATLAVASYAQDRPGIAGEISSRAAIEIDGTAMDAVPSWPLVDMDSIETTSAPGLLLTPDQNSIVLMPQTKARIRTFAPNQTWVFVQDGGVTVDTKNRNVYICIGNRLFEPAAATKGSLKLEKTGAVTRLASKGSLPETKGGCSEQNAAALSAAAAAASAAAGGTAGVAGAAGSVAVAGGTASGATAIGTSAIAVASAAGSVTATSVTTGLALVGGAAAPTANSCSSCNFNPTPVTPTTP